MLAFVAFVAIFNVLLGYFLGTYMAASRGRIVRVVGDVSQFTDSDDSTATRNRLREPASVKPKIGDLGDSLPNEKRRREAPRDDDSDYPLFAAKPVTDQLEAAVTS